MPYYITDKEESCRGWAVKAVGEERVFGCHATKRAAIAQAVAISLADDEEFVGERKADGPDVVICDIDDTLIHGGELMVRVWEFVKAQPGRLYIVTGRVESQRDETVKQLDDLGVEYSRLIMNPGSTADSAEYKYAVAEELLKTYNVTLAVENDGDTRDGYESLGIPTVDPEDIGDHVSEYENTDEFDSGDDMRAVDLSAPRYMRRAARRGVQLYEEGLAGDGVTDQTVAEARAMVQGNVTADKWVRIRAWIARHLVDLDAPQNQPGGEDFPGAGAVAFYLWGVEPTKAGAERVAQYASDVIARIEAENEGRAKGDALSKFETRISSAEFEVREEADGMHFTGYAAVFNSPSEPLPFIERIAPGAFKRSLRSKNDVKLLWNHDTGEVLGSTRAGTLSLVEDDRGLRVDAILPDTTRGRDLKVLLQRGDIDSMSFGFNVPAGGDAWNAEGTERTLKSVRLHEVSVVAFPAYTATAGTTSVRSLDAVAQRAEVDADQLAAALDKIEAGEDITIDDRNLLSTVIDKLSPVEEVVESDIDGEAMLLLKKKKLELLLNL